MCKHLGLDYFLISDWDLEKDFVDTLSSFTTEDELKKNEIYSKQTIPNVKATITTNWKLIHDASKEKIHFNIKKLETVLGYGSDNKDSLKIWQKLQETQQFSEELFPKTLELFLGIFEVENNNVLADDGLPF